MRQVTRVERGMKQAMGWMLVSGLILVAAAVYLLPTDTPEVTAVIPKAATGEMAPSVEMPLPADAVPDKIVLDVSVHTIEGLRVLFDRAEELAMTPSPAGEDASLVLVLHGPEVEFFSIRNYARYKEIVDQAARLDAFDVVDVRICQTMIGALGIEQTDIPSFIEQVPYGPGEVERLSQEGYVAF
jgi:intracellular sulfur oxidation DsrE/DsrF family protein